MKEYTKEPRKPREAAQESLPEDMIEGRNAVTEALRSGRTINKVFLADGDTDRALGRLAAMAKESGAVVVRVDRRKLNDMSPTGAHQGIMAAVAAHDYATVDDMLNAAQEKGEAPLLVICDELSDPHNLGAIIRTAECAGAHGVIIPRRRSVGLTAVVGKASAGALEYMPQGTRRVGVRHGSRRRHDPHRRGPARPGRHRHRQRGQRHEPPCRRELRSQGQYSPEGPHFIPECLDGRRRAAV